VTAVKKAYAEMSIVTAPPFMPPLYGGADFPIEILCRSAHVDGTEARVVSGKNRVTSMIVLLIQNLKLIMLFAWIGTVIGLSRLRRRTRLARALLN